MEFHGGQASLASKKLFPQVKVLFLILYSYKNVASIQVFRCHFPKKAIVINNRYTVGLLYLIVVTPVNPQNNLTLANVQISRSLCLLQHPWLTYKIRKKKLVRELTSWNRLLLLWHNTWHGSVREKRIVCACSFRAVPLVLGLWWACWSSGQADMVSSHNADRVNRKGQGPEKPFYLNSVIENSAT